MYARYSQCDPISAGLVNKPDQMVPFYVMDVASAIPGLSGLFIAGIFCAALRYVSFNQLFVLLSDLFICS